MAVTLNLLRLRYKFIFCTRQTTAHSSPCLSWESLPTDKTSFCVGSFHKTLQNKKPRNKSHWAFYGASDDSAEEKVPVARFLRGENPCCSRAKTTVRFPY